MKRSQNMSEILFSFPWAFSPPPSLPSMSAAGNAQITSKALQKSA